VIQLGVDEELIASLDRFEAEVSQLLAEALPEEAAGGPEKGRLIVLPEYSNVFPALIPLAELLEQHGSWEAAAAAWTEEKGEGGLKDFFLQRAPWVRSWMDRFYGEWAKDHRVWLLAGTYFAAEGRELRNRAVLYGPDGRARYSQDKVYLTNFERSTLGISPGEQTAARIFRAAGLRCALTICRDSFFESWEERFSDARLWVDLKANGQRWSAQNRELFETALPERIAASGVPWGLTVTLVGELYGLVWEGPSSLVRGEHDAPEGWISFWEAPQPDRETVKVLELPPARPLPASLYPGFDTAP
jgi:predicted amidohydrolase